jgi:deoxyribodipyrimidine photolyase-related protein
LPDEYRLQNLLDSLVSNISITHQAHDTEHFYTTRNELKDFFAGKKQLLMETFYRAMRKGHKVLMLGDEPLFGKWNLDAENREKLPKNYKPLKPYLFKNNLSDLHQEIILANLNTIGTVEAESFIWPTNREQSLQLLDFFVENCLPHFGTFQDAMTVNEWSLYHSRLSFSMNLNLISPHEVIEKAIAHFHNHEGAISYNQLEGFVRQIIGWREYMRGIYWMQMPEYAQLNYFNHKRKLPSWFWNGKTKMNCLSHSINQSIKYAYAHHIQRLMVTGNFALLAGIHPDEVDAWYLGIYIDAIEWVEITNTRGMSQYADGGIVASKPYVSSAAYIHKMGDYCTNCHYNKSIKVGEKACPFNSLYWHFFARNEDKLKSNPRIGMAYVTWQKMEATAKEALINQAEYYLENLESL